MKTTTKSHFSQVPKAEIPRSQFDRSHGYKTTFDSGYLTPIFIDEALPGDTFNLNLSAFARLATPLKPVMDNMFMEFFFFAVPYRLVWDNFQRFNGEQDNPADSTDFVIPTMTSPATLGHAVGSLSDYFGIPTDVPDLEHMSLFHRAYNLIWNQWFRDQNLQDSVVVDKDDGPDLSTDYVLLRRGKRHDYFTSCLPWPQKGTAVDVPIGNSAPVTRVPNAAAWTHYDAGTNTLNTAGSFNATGTGPLGQMTVLGSSPKLSLDPVGGLVADLSTATAATINQLRQAFQLQKLYERDARGGTRYTEIIKAHFGVTSPDARLQRAEYLGGGSTPVNMNVVPQNSATGTTGTPQGNLSGYAIAQANGIGFVKSFTEHCLIIGLCAVRADLSYQQGLSRTFSRSTRFDMYWPALAHIGEQAVLNKEIYAQGSLAATDDNVFGYQERYAEYRYKPSQITGQFRSTYAQSLDIWHLAQDFVALPALNASFIEDNPPIDRIIVTQTEPQFLYDSYISLKCARPMPIYSVPGLIDHF